MTAWWAVSARSKSFLGFVRMPYVLDLVDQGLDERLLEVDAAEVGAVAYAVPGADQGEGRGRPGGGCPPSGADGCRES